MLPRHAVGHINTLSRVMGRHVFICAQLLQRYRKRETFLEVNLGHVNEFRPDLLDMLTLRPVEYLPLFEQV